MNQEAFERICQLFESMQIEYRVLNHPECRSSAESAAARAQAGAPDAIGAKALLSRMEYSDHHTEFNVLVLPGSSRLDSRALKTEIPDLKRFRFATTAEMDLLCKVSPGAMPPFAQSVFPSLNHLYVDESLLRYESVGFNAANLERSIVVSCRDYIRVAAPAAILRYAVA